MDISKHINLKDRNYKKRNNIEILELRRTITEIKKFTRKLQQEIQGSRKDKSVNLKFRPLSGKKKGNRTKGPVGNHQMNQHMHQYYGTPRRSKKQTDIVPFKMYSFMP